jgi:hypothetical protein
VAIASQTRIKKKNTFYSDSCEDLKPKEVFFVTRDLIFAYIYRLGSNNFKNSQHFIEIGRFITVFTFHNKLFILL